MTETTEHYEYGYRLDDSLSERAGVFGLEMWGDEHGGDGTWIGTHQPLGIRLVDLDFLTDEESVTAIRRVLGDAGVRGVVLRRKVTTVLHDVEVLD